MYVVAYTVNAMLQKTSSCVPWGKLIGDCGCMVALTPGKEVQGKVICAYEGAGF